MWYLLVLLFGLASSLDSTDLCGTWSPLFEVKCSSGQECAADKITTFIVNTGFQFASDASYIKVFRMATGNCPFGDDAGTVIMAIDTIGYINFDNSTNCTLVNSNSTMNPNSTMNSTSSSSNCTYTSSSYTKNASSYSTGWAHVYYEPSKFNITLLKDNKAIYYTTQYSGPCMSPVSYWNDATKGCPCNGTWSATGSFNAATQSYDGTRTISLGKCPNNTCPENFFLNTTVQYGNLRYNFTNTTGVVKRTIELTNTSTIRTIGYNYGNKDIAYTFQAAQGVCKASVINPPSTPTNANGSNLISISTIMIMMVIFILKMYQNNSGA